MPDTSQAEQHGWPKRFVTRRGRRVVLRPARPDDVPRMLDFLAHLSPETRYRRFHVPIPDPPKEELLARLGETVDVPPDRGVVLVALEGETIVGSARCLKDPEGTAAEAAVVVRDDYQGEGIGSQLLRELALAACGLGITCLYAYIQPDNVRVLRLLWRARMPTSTRLEGPLLRVEVDIRHASSLRAGEGPHRGREEGHPEHKE